MKKYNQLKALLSLTKASILSNLRSPMNIFFGLIFPIIFVSIFGLIGKNTSTISIAVKKESNIDNPVIDALKQIPTIKLVYDMNEDEIDTKMSKGKIEASITIEKSNFDLPLYKVNLTTSNASQTSYQTEQLVSSIIDKINLNASPVKTNLISLESIKNKSREYKDIDFILPGQLGFSLLSTGVFSTAFVFLNLRETLVLKRFFATPTKKINIIIAEMISRLIISIAQTSIIILMGNAFLGFTLYRGILTFISMIIVAIFGLIIFMGFGFLVSGISKNDSTIAPIANIITLPQMLLSGTFFDIELFPIWLQNISKILPLTYFNEALRKIAFEGASIFQVWNNLLILCIWGIGIYALTVKTFKWE